MKNNKKSKQKVFCPYCGSKMEYKFSMIGVGDEVEWEGEWFCNKCEDYTLNKKMRELADNKGGKIL